MLRNELKEIEELLIELSFSDSNTLASIKFDLYIEQIHKAWEGVIFSNSSENSLVRYFHYHLDLIISVSDNFYVLQDSKEFRIQQNELLALIDHLQHYYLNYFNQNAFSPIIYHQRSVAQLSDIVNMVANKVENGKLNFELKACLLKWISDLSDNVGKRKYTFHSLYYFENIISKMAEIDYTSEDAENSLTSVLTCFNYNSLSFFVFRQKTIRNSSEKFQTSEEKLNFLYRQKAEISSSPEMKDIAYDPSWPSIKTMIGNWLTEEILLAEKSLSKASEVVVPKIPLEMSVAHLSCLIHLLYEESVFATQNLQSIFKCFASYFQSKRQAVISPGSLSKEFYSIDQHTAARVRDLLQRMVLRINRNFFPMVVAINATILSYLSMR